MTDKTTRRSALTMLGIAAPASVAAAAAAMSQPVGETYRFGGARTKETIARALRAMADDIERDATHTLAARVHSVVNAEEFLTHTIEIDFVMKGETDV